MRGLSRVRWKFFRVLTKGNNFYNIQARTTFFELMFLNRVLTNVIKNRVESNREVSQRTYVLDLYPVFARPSWTHKRPRFIHHRSW